MIQSTKFTQVNNPFLKKLKDDIKLIKNETKLLIATDKTTNFYKLETSSYNDLLEQKPSIQKTKASQRNWASMTGWTPQITETHS